MRPSTPLPCRHIGLFRPILERIWSRAGPRTQLSGLADACTARSRSTGVEPQCLKPVWLLGLQILRRAHGSLVLPWRPQSSASEPMRMAGFPGWVLTRVLRWRMISRCRTTPLHTASTSQLLNRPHQHTTLALLADRRPRPAVVPQRDTPGSPASAVVSCGGRGWSVGLIQHHRSPLPCPCTQNLRLASYVLHRQHLRYRQAMSGLVNATQL